MTIGIPRSLFYYHDGEVWISFFKSLNINYIISNETNSRIMSLGNKYATDEMCLSMKNYIGHVASLVGKCDTVLVPRIDNYGRNDQTCTNFLLAYDLIRNLFPINIITYNINLENKETEENAYIKIGNELGFSRQESLAAYHNAITDSTFQKEKKIIKNIDKLDSKKIKILLISHPYNTYDEFIGKPIIKILMDLNVEIIYSDLFHYDITNPLSKRLSDTIYFKYNKDLIGSILICESKIDGIIFLSSFPCGPDSIVNELVMRRIKKPYLNLIIDDMDSQVGFETRIESFVDILERGKKI